MPASCCARRPSPWRRPLAAPRVVWLDVAAGPVDRARDPGRVAGARARRRDRRRRRRRTIAMRRGAPRRSRRPECTSPIAASPTACRRWERSRSAPRASGRAAGARARCTACRQAARYGCIAARPAPVTTCAWCAPAATSRCDAAEAEARALLRGKRDLAPRRRRASRPSGGVTSAAVRTRSRAACRTALSTRPSSRAWRPRYYRWHCGPRGRRWVGGGRGTGEDEPS